MADQSSLTLVRQALAEDLAGYGDVTSACIVPQGLQGQAEIVAHQDMVVCGVPLAAMVVREIDVEVEFTPLVCDGAPIAQDEPVALIRGSVRSILSAERTMLNFLCHLSGVASQARRFSAAVEGLEVAVVDTRKTTPGLRAWEKRAVVLGGCRNHRFGLFDMVLIKNNHLIAAGGVRKAIALARESCPHSMKIEVEVENEDDLREAIRAGADVIMLDNRSPESLRDLVGIARSLRPELVLEASGGVTMENLRAIAESGVDLVSTSAITMGAPPADLSLRLRSAV